MANESRAQFIHVDAATAENARRHGMDPHRLELSAMVVLRHLYDSLPDVPVYAGDRFYALSPASSVDGNNEERISALPLALLRNIVSRLPVKDAARTAVLYCRWRPVWRCTPTPLVLADIHLFPGYLPGHRRQPARADTPELVASVSRVLASHPGPFRTIHIVCGYLDAHQRQVARWVQTLADKGVQELVSVNHPFPLDVPLPAALFRISTLTQLYLGVWKFPDTSALQRGGGCAFPNLRQLVLCSMNMENRDLDFLLASSPVLETLGILASMKGMRRRLASQHLRCVQISLCSVDTIVLVECPNLERLFMWGLFRDEGSCIRVKIGNAPKLHQLGFLKPGVQMLEIGNTVVSPLINSGIKASPSIMAPGVRILGIRVRFGVRNDAKMLPTFLRCFPNVEMLHNVSAGATEITGKANLKFWQEAGPINCIQGINSMSFREFRGEGSELSFLKFFFQNAEVLKNAVVLASKGSFTSTHEVISKVESLSPENWASKRCSLLVSESKIEGGGFWSFCGGLDLSVSDPFVEVKGLTP